MSVFPETLEKQSCWLCGWLWLGHSALFRKKKCPSQIHLILCWLGPQSMACYKEHSQKTSSDPLEFFPLRPKPREMVPIKMVVDTQTDSLCQALRTSCHSGHTLEERQRKIEPRSWGRSNTSKLQLTQGMAIIDVNETPFPVYAQDLFSSALD